MQDQLITSAEPAKVRQKKEVSKTDKILAFVRQIIAILFWFYVLVKLFIFDIDVAIINKFFPEYIKYLNFKILFIIGIISIIWLITKNKYILPWFFYILLFPFIVFFWKIPYFIFKQRSWTLAFAFINSVISFFKSIRYTFIASSFYIISASLIFIFTNKFVLGFAILIILSITLFAYANRFIIIFKPTSVFQVYTYIFSKIKTFGSKSPALFMLEDDIKIIPFKNLDEKQLAKWTASLQTSVLYNRLCLFVAKKLRDYQSSKLNFVYYIFGIFTLIVITTLSFSFINYGLYKIDSAQFGYLKIPTYFTFFYYSFNHLFNNDILGLVSILPISQIVSMIEPILSLIIIGIFVSSLITVMGEKHAEELNKVIESVETQGIEMESFIQEEFKITNIGDAIKELDKVKAGLLQIIMMITNNLK